MTEIDSNSQFVGGRRPREVLSLTKGLPLDKYPKHKKTPVIFNGRL